MNRTVTISIGGFVFHIEEDAYEKLKRYLDAIRGSFSSADGRDEIIADIEARIAELFRERTGDKKEVITADDVAGMIAVMGEPETYRQEDGGREEPSPAPAAGKGSRRIFRDPDNRILGGVCSGIAAYFGFDPLWLRLAFAASFFLFGSGVLFYILLWVIIPKAGTTAEKLEMKGETVNISNIERSIREELDTVKSRFHDNLENSGMRKHAGDARNFMERLFSFTGKLAVMLFRAIGRVTGLTFTITGIILLACLAGIFFGSDFAAWRFDFSDAGWKATGCRWDDFRSTFFAGVAPWKVTAAFFALFLTLGIPLLGMIYGGVKLLFNIRHRCRGVGITLFALWISGAVMLCVTGFRIGLDFGHGAAARQSVSAGAAGDTLYLDVGEDRFNAYECYHPEYFEFVEFEDDRVYFGCLRLDIRKSSTDSISLEVIKSSRGRSHRQALDLAENISYAFALRDSLVVFDPFFSFDRSRPWRLQEVEVIVRLPEGVVVDLSPRMDRIIYDIANTDNLHDRKMVGHKWKMTAKGLECVTCGEVES